VHLRRFATLRFGWATYRFRGSIAEPGITATPKDLGREGFL
jgi:hypothetical protein